VSEILIGIFYFTSFIVLLTLAVTAARSLMFPVRAVTVSVNDTKTLPCRTGSRLLDVLLSQGIEIPAVCGGKGTCGLCRVSVTSGGRKALPIEKGHITMSESDEGARLACQLIVRDDIAIRVLEEYLNIDSWACEVRSTRSLSPMIKEIVLNLPPLEQFEFRPGAYVLVTAPPYQLDFANISVSKEYEGFWRQFDLHSLSASNSAEVKRAYSIANRPDDLNRIVLLIRLALPPPSDAALPPGLVSSYLFGLSKGDTLEVTGPYGDFCVKESQAEMLFIGGGVGMAPLRAMIADQLKNVGTQRKISFWYGARSADDLFYVEELSELAREHDNFRWTVALSDPTAADHWEGETGFIHDVVFANYLKDHTSPEDCEYYLCGPPLMIKAVIGMLEGLGVGEENIFNDDFGGST
jgi:Na+-transporting NADH:ubiquinone oxidoreductase subunit F